MQQHKAWVSIEEDCRHPAGLGKYLKLLGKLLSVKCDKTFSHKTREKSEIKFTIVSSFQTGFKTLRRLIRKFD
jgi:hypothetical protein